ncbi:anaerobic ribonucleoside-triphosphate reductase [Acetonema longum]|uniref:Uncharacterized protein n=1 Tax=Acetonema longum DSM 6540 TaxID=1009370 RepID=F7NK43_9FIRM|nr:anaerobic ribonucleoside-triphosphate reductase [Acetonema longum]EGO63484.1 hypothetical protein ALO_12281 [Acetonema longum DSM 6540]
MREPDLIIRGIPIHVDCNITADEVKKLVNEEIDMLSKQKFPLASIRIFQNDGKLMIQALAKIKRLRRITGYLSSIDNFNDAKKAELNARVAHIDPGKNA